MNNAKRNEAIQFLGQAFSGEGRRANRATVDADGTIRVWDSTAGHYTLCHSVRPSTARRLRAIAAKSA